MPHHILIAPDKFKGSLPARAVAEALGRGITSVRPEAIIHIHPMADGGDGSLAVLQDRLRLQSRTIATVDPLGRPIQASYAFRGQEAYVELAAASGLVLLSPAERNPMLTSTFGTGILLRDAIQRGAKKIYLFLGGSATNDLGFGIAAALGYRFLAGDGQEVAPNGAGLAKINQIVAPENMRLEEVEFILLCDVKNPLYGPNGAAHVYAAQKGANADMIEQLDLYCRSSKAVIERHSGIDVSQLAGGGAAGGVAAGLYGLMNTKIVPGFSTISKLTGLEEQLKKADLVISGEGRLDQQSLEGKVVDGVAKYCQQHQKRLLIVAGQSNLKTEEVAAANHIYTIMERANSLEDAMNRPADYLEKIGREIGGKLG